MEHRDLYEALGVPLDVEPAALKRAYRELAKRYHPDRNPSRQAEESFKEVAFAYRILSNPRARALYDKYGPVSLRDDFDPSRVDPLDQAIYEASRRRASQAGGPSAAPRPPGRPRRRAGDTSGRPAAPRGRAAHCEVALPMSLVPSGAVLPVSYTREVTCGRCAGSATEPGTAARLCGTCNGLGRVGLGPSSKPCQSCQGTGKRLERPCQGCHGQGYAQQPASLKLRVPPGTHDGAQVTVRGRGHASRVGGQPGDLMVKLVYTNDTPFERHGVHLHTTLKVYPWQAALGLEVRAPTLTGDITLRLPEGSTGGQELIHPGCGLPTAQGRAGHMVYRLCIYVPPPQTPQERDLYQRLGQLHGTPEPE